MGTERDVFVKKKTKTNKKKPSRVRILTLALNGSFGTFTRELWWLSSSFETLDFAVVVEAERRSGTYNHRNISSPFSSIRGACLLWSPPCAAGHRRYSRGHDRPPAAPGRALAVAPHGGPAGGAGPAGPGARAAGPASGHQGGTAEPRSDGEVHHPGGGVRGRKCRLRGGKTNAGNVSLSSIYTVYLSFTPTHIHIKGGILSGFHEGTPVVIQGIHWPQSFHRLPFWGE